MPGFKNILTALTKNKPAVPAKTNMLTKDDAAAMLNMSREALDAFEASYQKEILSQAPDTSNLFDINAKQAGEIHTAMTSGQITDAANAVIKNIINELLEQTQIMEYDGENLNIKQFDAKTPVPKTSLDDVKNLPAEIQPQLTGIYAKRDIDESTAMTLLYNYKRWKEAKSPDDKKIWYHMFRQGLDILDLDPITYEILSTNPTSIGNWFPGLVHAVQNQDFFKIPKTKIMKVPLTLLQLTRQDYGALTPSTIKILNEFCFKAFELDETQDYFIKTGTYSSKFDFRNAHVQGAKEVRELGQYLLFIHFQALQMASPLSKPCIYGVSTTNEWVVREYIQNSQNLPEIYKGLPLRTEYRIFVDFNDNTIIGTNPYWDPDVMLQRFGHEPDADSPHQVHDYIIYKSQAGRLMDEYNANIENIKAKLQPMLIDFGLTGQWSVDIMQDGNDFYIIDMATAETSALNNCIPRNLLKHREENWMPKLDK